MTKTIDFKLKRCGCAKKHAKQNGAVHVMSDASTWSTSHSAHILPVEHRSSCEATTTSAACHVASGPTRTPYATSATCAVTTHKSKQTKAAQIVFAVFILLACLSAQAAAPTSAFAMQTQQCTARPNSDSGNDIMGATNTRITWEGQAQADEQIAGFKFTLPQGTNFSTDDLRVTMLTGADLMTRNKIDATATSVDNTINVKFQSAAEAGGYFRVEIYNVFFPAEGGQMQVDVAYTLADGQTKIIEDTPAISVVGVTPAEQLSQYLSEQQWVKDWNSVRFLHMFLDPTLIVTSFPVVFDGFLMAVAIVACAFPLAMPFGFLLALMRISRFRILRGLARVYVNIVRGTPLFLQIYVAFFGLPLAGIQIPTFPLGVIVLSMNSCAYMCEIFRAGIQSIHKGQFEASRSLGMNGAQTMLYVIIPQTVRRVIPTLTSEFILLYKDTSMLAAVGVMEVVMYAKTIVASTGSITPYIVAAVFYLVVTLPMTWVVSKFENKLAAIDGGKVKTKTKDKNKKKPKDKDEPKGKDEPKSQVDEPKAQDKTNDTSETKPVGIESKNAEAQEG